MANSPTLAATFAASFAPVSLAAAALASPANDLLRHLRHGRRHSLPGWGLGLVRQLVRLWDRLRRLWLTPPSRPATQSASVPPATTLALTATTPATLATTTFASAAFVTATLVAALATAADGSLTGLATGDAQLWATPTFAASARAAPTPSASISAAAFAALSKITSVAKQREARALHGDSRAHTDGQRQRGRLLRHLELAAEGGQRWRR